MAAWERLRLKDASASNGNASAPGLTLVEPRGLSQQPAVLPQLDSLRAIAVVAVLVEHYIPDRGNIPFGPLGVRLFFVLSGFLITGILFRNRQDVDRGTQSAGHLLRNFFARRFIRLMPVYYVYL